jgi:GTPase SAR1 family protein
VYDVSNRETFEALPRWYSELETYVSESVVKIIVGNKVDKVRRSPPLLHLLPNTSTGILPTSTNI